MLLSERFFDWFVGIVFLLFMVIVYVSYAESKDEEKECKAHGGKPYHEEKVIVEKTSNGCRVIRLTMFTKDCLYIKSVFLTECPSYTTIGDGENPKNKKHSKINLN